MISNVGFCGRGCACDFGVVIGGGEGCVVRGG